MSARVIGQIGDEVMHAVLAFVAERHWWAGRAANLCHCRLLLSSDRRNFNEDWRIDQS
jgi:hypothetical protein